VVGSREELGLLPVAGASHSGRVASTSTSTAVKHDRRAAGTRYWHHRAVKTEQLVYSERRNALHLLLMHMVRRGVSMETGGY